VTWQSSPLGFRNGSLTQSLVRKPITVWYHISNIDAAEIVRKSGSESSEDKSVNRCNDKGAPSRVRGDSSRSSAEELLLFKGNASRRAARASVQDVSHSTRTSQEPMRVQTQLTQPAQGHAEDFVRDQARDQTRPTEWNYHGRSDSEAATAEPLPAPTGIPTQRSEGFQRFYKAVVSPTHVRVTAGGRIVPNNRAGVPMSPTTKRSREDVGADSNSISDRTIHGKPSLGHVGMAPSVSMIPQLIPGFPPGLQAMQTPVSFLPIPFGTPIGTAYSFGQQGVPSPNIGQHPVIDSTLRDMHNAKPTEPQAENAAALDNQDKVKITPPEFFDYSKPFYFNGQCLYPVPAAPAFPPGVNGPILPVQMVSIAPTAAAQAPGHRVQPVSGGQVSSLPPQPLAGPVRNNAPAPTINPAIPANANIQPQLAPPISSIKPSEITKKQINSFKQSLKYHEDQLQYNRHQIDEKDMEAKIQTLRSHIQRFEATLKMQLEYEASVLGQAPEVPKDDKTQNANVPVDSANTAHKRRVARAKADAILGPTLPSGAALAPVFKPRFHSSSWGDSPVNTHTQEAQDETETRLLAAAG